MEDCRDTIIVTGIGTNVQGEDFINYFSKLGKIKTNRMTGQRLATMRKDNRTKKREGIVTYENIYKAAEAVKHLNDAEINGSCVKVQLAEDFYHPCLRNKEIYHYHVYGEENTAWQLWFSEANFDNLGQTTKRDDNDSVVRDDAGYRMAVEKHERHVSRL